MTNHHLKSVNQVPQTTTHRKFGRGIDSYVTSQSLQYHDRIGVLLPARRTETGYRLYTLADLFRLQQIRTLKWMGFPVKEAAALLDGKDSDVISNLSLQKEATERCAGELRAAAALLGRMINMLRADENAVFDAHEMAEVLNAVERNYRHSWFKNHFSEEQWTAMRDNSTLKAHGETWAELWQALITAYGRKRKPADPDVQEIAGRIRALTSDMARDFADHRPSLRAAGKDLLENEQAAPPFMKADPGFARFFSEAI